ncbi:MAG: DR2241 family protein [Verrucomicrobiota bacterium]
MNAFENPALKAFAAQLERELIFGEVLLHRLEHGFELRHVADRDSENLRLISENQIRALVQFTANGEFRPLKSAPNLQSGWRIPASNEPQLESALNTIYPGAIADWFAVRFSQARPTDYREFTNRQTGMYRTTTMLTDEQAAPVIRACCHKKFCLKQRLWTVSGLRADLSEEKSLIPCLEPCAILLEFARKAMRLEQQKDSKKAEPINMEASETNPEIREADFENPNNPRRRQLEIEKSKTG